MKTATIYTCYPLSHIRFGVTHASCSVEKPNICHAEDVGYALTITIPDDATLETNDFGAALLYRAGASLPAVLYYNDINNCVEGGWGGSGTPIKGLHIIKKVEI